MKKLITLLFSLLCFTGYSQYLKNLKPDTLYELKSLSNCNTTCSEYTKGKPPRLRLCMEHNHKLCFKSVGYYCDVVPYTIGIFKLNLNEHRVYKSMVVYDLTVRCSTSKGPKWFKRGKLIIRIPEGTAFATFELEYHECLDIDDRITRTRKFHGVFGKEASDLIKK